MNILLQGFLFFLIYCILATGFVFGMGIIGAKNKWNMKITLAISLFVALSSLVIVIWLGTRDTSILAIGLFISFFGSALIFTWPHMIANSLKSLFDKFAGVGKSEGE